METSSRQQDGILGARKEIVITIYGRTYCGLTMRGTSYQWLVAGQRTLTSACSLYCWGCPNLRADVDSGEQSQKGIIQGLHPNCISPQPAAAVESSAGKSLGGQVI